MNCKKKSAPDVIGSWIYKQDISLPFLISIYNCRAMALGAHCLSESDRCRLCVLGAAVRASL